MTATAATTAARRVATGGLRISRVQKRRGPEQALKEVDQDNAETEVWLLRLFAGFEVPDREGVKPDGQDLTGLSMAQRPVDTVVRIPHLSGTENVASGRRSVRVAVAELQTRTGGALKYGIMGVNHCGPVGTEDGRWGLDDDSQVEFGSFGT